MEQLIVHGEHTTDQGFVATVVGAIEPITSGEFMTKVRALGVGIDVLDLRFVPLFTAAGVTALLNLTQQRPCRVVASTVVSRVLEIVGLHDAFDVTVPVDAPSMDHADFGVATYDSLLRFTYVNRAMAAINGLSVDDHLGRRPVDVFDLDPEHNDVVPLLEHVLGSGRGRDVVVQGETPVDTGNWLCRVRPSHYVVNNTAQRALITRVTPVAMTNHAASHRLVFALAS